MTLPSLRSRKRRVENEQNLRPHGALPASMVQQPQREKREEKGQREDMKR